MLDKCHGNSAIALWACNPCQQTEIRVRSASSNPNLPIFLPSSLPTCLPTCPPPPAHTHLNSRRRLLIFEYNFRVQLSARKTLGFPLATLAGSQKKQRRFREGTKRTFTNITIAGTSNGVPLDFTSKEGRLRWRRSLQCCPRPLLRLVKWF